MKVLSNISVYPLKSGKGISLQESWLDELGLVNDRRLMLVDSSGRFVTQRQNPKIGLIDVRADGDNVEFRFGGSEIRLSRNEFSHEESVVVWRDSVMADMHNAALAESLSDFLDEPVGVAWISRRAFRQVDREYYDVKQAVSFADGFPLLIISNASLDDLNSRLEAPLSMQRFRPNLVIDGCEAYEEDRWKRIAINGVEISLVKPCSRCVITTIDPLKAEKSGKEPLATLGTYRKNQFGVCFGQNAVHHQTGLLKVGASVEVLEWH